MSESIDKSVKRFNERAKALERLLFPTVHQDLRLHIERTAATLRACAIVLSSVRDLADAELEARLSKVDAAIGQVNADLPGRLGQFFLYGTTLQVVATRRTLLQSADLLSSGQDRAVLRQFGKHALQTAAVLGASIGATVSGVALAGLLVAGASAAKDLHGTVQTWRLRRQQVRVASDLLTWVDNAWIAGATWLYAAEMFLLALQDRTVSEDDMHLRVAARIEGRDPADFNV